MHSLSAAVVKSSPRYLIMEPGVQGDTTLGAPPVEDKWLPLLHLNVGWSF